MLARFIYNLELAILVIIFALILSGSNNVVRDQEHEIRTYTRPIEFDFFNWTLKALGSKISQDSINTPYYFSSADRHQLVLDYLQNTQLIIQKEDQINLVFTDPNVENPMEASRPLRDELKTLVNENKKISGMAESILEEQVSDVLGSEGLNTLDQPFPPVLFHITPLPNDLIISPRNIINQAYSYSLISDLPVDQQVLIENKIIREFNVSALVVPVGGIGSYPTMIERSTSLDWLSNTIAHEWTHNWLEFKPLGQNYDKSNDLRTMNETTASIAGTEIGSLVIKRYYPELQQASYQDSLVSMPFSRPDPGDLPRHPFDFRAEMHTTRVKVDELLKQGLIQDAENYMESRRKVFWAHGYAIRRLNQAYFAFYGAYAEVPGGAAGEDPVGPAVRALREQSVSLADFLEKIAQMSTFTELKSALEQ